MLDEVPIKFAPSQSTKSFNLPPLPRCRFKLRSITLHTVAIAHTPIIYLPTRNINFSIFFFFFFKNNLSKPDKKTLSFRKNIRFTRIFLNHSRLETQIKSVENFKKRKNLWIEYQNDPDRFVHHPWGGKGSINFFFHPQNG